MPDIELSKRPEDVLAELKDADKDYAVMAAERRRVASRLNRLVVIAVLSLVASIVWAWLSRP